MGGEDLWVMLLAGTPGWCLGCRVGWSSTGFGCGAGKTPGEDTGGREGGGEGEQACSEGLPF